MYLLKNTLNTKYKDIDFSPCYFVDLIMNAEYDPIEKVVLELANLDNYWGQGVDEPIIAFTNIKITSDNISLLKESTLKIDCGKYNFIKLGTSSPEEYDGINPGMGVKTLTIIGTCSINEWGGYMTPQIKIMDYEVTNSIPYYF